MFKIVWGDFSEYLKYGKSGKKIKQPSSSHKTAFNRVLLYFNTHKICFENRYMILSWLKNTYHINKNSTINNHIKVIKPLAEYIGSPLREIFMTLEGLPEETPLIIPFTDTEIEKVILAGYSIGLYEGTILELLSVTGFRNNSELCQLKWTDLVDGRLTAVNTKNGRPHTIHLPQEMTRKLNVYKATQKRHNGYIFEGQGSKGHIQYNTVNKIAKKAAKLAGIDRPVIAHLFRHSLFTIARENGADIYDISEYANHKKITSTTKYIHMASRKCQQNIQLRLPYIAKKLSIRDFETDQDEFIKQYRNTPLLFEKKYENGKVHYIISLK
jgi:integrase